MKKLFLAALLSVALLVSTATAQITDHPKYINIQTLTNNFISTITDAQDAYYIQHGYYFHGPHLVDLTTYTPDGDIDVATDVTRKAENRNETWADFDSSIFKQNLKIPFDVWVNPYDTSYGRGWIVTIELWYELDPPYNTDAFGNTGNHWIYRHNEGPLPSYGIYDEWFIQEEYIP